MAALGFSVPLTLIFIGFISVMTLIIGMIATVELEKIWTDSKSALWFGLIMVPLAIIFLIGASYKGYDDFRSLILALLLGFFLLGSGLLLLAVYYHYRHIYYYYPAKLSKEEMNGIMELLKTNFKEVKEKEEKDGVLAISLDNGRAGLSATFRIKSFKKSDGESVLELEFKDGSKTEFEKIKKALGNKLIEKYVEVRKRIIKRIRQRTKELDVTKEWLSRYIKELDELLTLKKSGKKQEFDRLLQTMIVEVQELVKAKERKKDEHPTPSGQRNGTEVEGYSVYDQLLISDPKNMMDDLEEIKDGKTGKQVNRVANLIKYLESGEFERAVEKQKEWLLLKAKKAGISKYDLENFDEESAIGSL